jgi:predicted CXXCH cytochrome family protein
MTTASTILLVLALGAPAPEAAKSPVRPPTVESAARFKLKPGATGAACLECHGELQQVVSKAVVHTPVRSRDCVGCHNPHASDHGKLLAAEPGQICAKCHPSIVPANAKSLHKPLTEKGCVACHDAHASENKFVLLKPETALCASCHQALVDGAGKAKYKHRPVDSTGCGTCHDPHGSDKSESLLKAAVPALCLNCHKTTTPIFSKAHLGYPVAKADCTSCHDPHGSERRGMLWNNVHPPVAKLMCGTCHEPPTSPTALQPKEGAPGLCRSCHSVQLGAMLESNRLHQPVLEGRACLTCHGPHASKQKGLLRGSMISVCGSCHQDTIQRNERAPEKHEPVDQGQCTACHNPHGASGALLFAKPDRVEMCQECHDWLKHSSHPIGQKAVDPRNKNLRVECLSCHRAHGTASKKLLLSEKQSELCTKCHESYRR